MKPLRTIYIVLLAVFILVIILIALLTMLHQPPRSKIVVYAYNDDITGIDPSLEDDTGLVVLGSTYETLTYYNYTTGKVEPRLALSWESSEDGKEWIFHLRRDVVFHDGTPFNATAVKMSIERARDIYRETGRGAGYIWDAVDEIIVVDEYTVKFKLKYPQKLDLLASASYAAYIFSPSALEKSGASSIYDKALEDWFNKGNAIGTGPYKLISYDPTREIRLEKFNKWWGWSVVNNPYAPDVVIIKIVKEPPAQYHGLLAGEIDIACSVPRTTIRDLVEKGFKVINVSTFHNFVLFFNTKRYPTNISYFRLAIAYALNLTEIVQVAVYGFALEASGVIPHGFPGHVEGLKYNHNLETSKKYLEFSGVKMPIKIELLYQVDYEETRKFAELFKSRMSELGIEVELNPQDWARLKDIAKGVWTSPESTPHLILADWWPTMPSPFDYLYAMFHSESKEWNFAGYENPEFDSLIEEALTLEGVNYTRALELYKDAQILLFEEAVAVGLWDEIRPFTYSSRIEMPQEALNPMYTFVIRFELVSVRS